MPASGHFYPFRVSPWLVLSFLAFALEISSSIGVTVWKSHPTAIGFGKVRPNAASSIPDSCILHGKPPRLLHRHRRQGCPLYV